MQVQRQVLRQEQRLKMTPQLYQAIRILALPVQELKLNIEEELERNPALEVVEDKGTVSLEENLRQDTDAEEEGYFDDASDSGYGRSRSSDDDNAKKKFIEGVATRPESLQEHLMQQLRVQPIEPERFAIGEALIMNLDENGFHREPPETLVDAERRHLLPALLDMIRSFDPVGCCTADYRESLLVQIALHPEPHPRAAEIIKKHLELAERGKHKEIARKMRSSEEEVRAALEFIRRLEPIPGRNFSTEGPKYVVPDVMVKLQDGQFMIYLNDEEIPVLGVNPFFRDLMKKETSRDKPREVKKFVAARVQDARWFIRSIHQRNETLLKVSRAIVESQREFFRRGPKYLVPLTLKDIAQQVEVHEATVSRITNGKYMQTEWGLFELKYFFSNPVSSARPDGSRFSKEGVKQVIKELIVGEGGAHLPDAKIVELLAARGITIARRTVAKYRKELDIMSSYRR